MTNASEASWFIAHLNSEALHSAAVDHPYLTSMRKAAFPNTTAALQDFAIQYSLYSHHFTDYVSAVIGQLKNPEHKRLLQINLAEEQGDASESSLSSDVKASIEGQPHTVLFQRFQQALNCSSALSSNRGSNPGQQWSQRFLRLCKTNQYVGIGAIGLGTELIVPSIYAQILDGVKAHGELTPQQYVFFELHSECDHEHAAQLSLIAEELAETPFARDQLELGVRSAIEMRIAFWDAMLERAQSISSEISLADFELNEIQCQI